MLEAINLRKEYNNFCALNSLNIKVEPGDIYCLLGANGAGKSTTINLFLGFIEATSGSVSINGLNVSRNNMETKKFLSYIPENLMLYPTLTGLENLEYFVGLANKKYSKTEFINFLTEAGLQTNAHLKRVSTYSKGMRQKVGIAIALAKDAKVLLLDEPTSGLDPRASNEFSTLLLTLKNKGIATLMATHDIFRAKQIATHIGIMKEGNLVESFKSEDITLKALEDLYLETIDS